MSGEGMLGAAERMPVAIARRAALGDSVRQWRAGASLTVRDAALQLGVTPAWIEDAERKRIDPMAIGPSTATRVLQQTGLTAQDIGLEPAAGDPHPTGTATAGAPGDVPTSGAPDPLRLLPIVLLHGERHVALRMRHAAAGFILTADEAEVLGRQLVAHAELARA